MCSVRIEIPVSIPGRAPAAKFGHAGAVAPDPILVHRTSGEVSWAGLSGHEAFMERIRTGKGR